jgi:hypothetical protein
MVGRPSSQSNTRRWHRLVEHYAPDGALGRVLLAAASGSVSGFALLATLFSIAEPNLLLFVLFPLWAGLCLGTAVLTVVALWPVYLSLIGNVASAKDYPRTSSPSSSSDGSDETDPIETDSVSHSVRTRHVSRIERDDGGGGFKIREVSHIVTCVQP